MKQTTSTVKMNFAAIRQITQAQIKALKLTIEQVHTDVVQEQVTPRDRGTLQGEKTFVDFRDAAMGRVSLVAEGPYARRLYYHPEYNFSTAENPNAKGRWLDDYLKGGSKEDYARDIFTKLFKGESGV
jgi:hypothetical protein